MMLKPYTTPKYQWSLPTCCMLCRVDSLWDQVNMVINNMPPELWALFLAKMYTPFLHRIAVAEERGRMPANWIAKLPPRRPPSSARRHFYDACRLALDNPAIEGNMARPVLLQMYQSIFSLLTMIQPYMTADAFSNLWAQKSMLNGNFELFTNFSRAIKHHSPACSMVSFARQAVRIGAEEHILALIDQELGGNRTRPMLARHTKKLSDAHVIMTNMRTCIHAVKDAERARRLVIAMALHPRLGASSALSALSEELIVKCVGPLPAELVRWDELAGEWLV